MKPTRWPMLLLVGLMSNEPSAAEQSVGFTAEEADAGRTVYARECRACHGEGLEGVGVSPALTGARFDAGFRGGRLTTLNFHIRRMPPAAPGGLTDAEYNHLAAFILQHNGLSAGETSIADAAGTKIPGAVDRASSRAAAAGSEPLLDQLPSLSNDTLAAPAPDDWLHWGGDYAGQSHTPLKQITRENVARLSPAWRAPLSQGPAMPMPLVSEGVMFLQVYPDTVLALDATSGRQLWRYVRPGLAQSNKKMGMALHGGRVYVATSDLAVIALDVKTGKPVWEHAVALGPHADKLPIFLRGAPLIAGDMVIQGTMSFRVPRGGYIVGINRNSGEEAWRFNTVAWPGQPGGHTWNGIDVDARNGGSVWHLGTYDPQLNLIYYGVAPTYDTAPLLYPSKLVGVTNDALYTNSTVAIAPATGELVWHYQHTKNDQWDMDWVFERTLADLPTLDGKSRRVVMNVGKNAMVDVLDAATGEFLFSLDAGVQNIIAAVDPETGEKQIDPQKMPSKEHGSVICPSPFGARSWPPTAFSPATGLLYAPLTESCFSMSETGRDGRLLTTGVDLENTRHPGHSDGRLGRVQAYDIHNRRLGWNTDLQRPVSTGLLTTAGGLVFAGDLDPSLKALDDRTGEVLWHAPLDAAPSSSIISYAVDGRQYVAVVAGIQNIHVGALSRYDQWARGDPQPAGDEAGPAVWVFALP